MKNKLNV